MKDIIIGGIIGIMLCLLSIGLVWIGKTVNPQHPVDVTTDTVYVSDTVAQLKPQYVTIVRNDTVRLPVYINDTVTDTFAVQIPISHYVYDTIMEDTTHTTRFFASLTGYAVTLDTLYVNTEIMHQTKENRAGRWVPAVGVGYGTGGLGLFLGVGYSFNKVHR
jgi:hypothetical protein